MITIVTQIMTVEQDGDKGVQLMSERNSDSETEAEEFICMMISDAIKEIGHAATLFSSKGGISEAEKERLFAFGARILNVIGAAFGDEHITEEDIALGILVKDEEMTKENELLRALNETIFERIREAISKLQ